MKSHHSGSSDRAAGPPSNLLVIGICLLLGVSQGLSFGTAHSNHVTYLLPGIAMIEPDYLKNDWWLQSTVHYHWLFTYLVAFFERLGSLAWGLAGIQIGVIAVTFGVLYRWLVRLQPETGFESWLLLSCMALGLPGIRAAGVVDLFTDALQPATLSMSAWVIGAVAFLRGKYLISGVVMALGGLFHVNFLLLTFPWLGLAHLLLGREQLVQRLSKQFTPLFVTLTLQWPVLYDVIQTTATVAEQTRARAFFNELMAHHYRPPVSALFDNFGYTILGCVMLIWRRPNAGWRPLDSLLLSCMLCLWVPAALNGLFHIAWLEKLFFWRLGPILFLFVQAQFAVWLLQVWRDPMVVGGPPNAWLARLLMGFAALCIALQSVFYTQDEWPSARNLVVMGFVVWMVLGYSASIPKPIHRLRPWVFMVFLSSMVLGQHPSHFQLLHGGPGKEESAEQKELMRWLRHNTADDALVLAPVQGFSTIRIQARRAMVVSWQAIPHETRALLEHQRRFEMVRAAYREDQKYSDVLMAFRPDYVVMHRGRGRKLSGESVFQNRAFEVKRIRYPLHPEP